MFIVGFVIFIYLLFRAILPVKGNIAFKIFGTLLIALGAFKYSLVYFLGGPMFFAPQLPAWGLAVASLLYGGTLFFAVLVLFGDLLWILFWAGRKLAGRSGSFRHAHNQVNLLLLTLSLLLAGIGWMEAERLPRVRKLTLEVPDLPQSIQGMRVVALADLHADVLNDENKMAGIVLRTNALEPDLVVIVGDFVDGTVLQRGKTLVPLRALNSRLGVYGVSGNHEYYSGYGEWKKHLERLGIRMLDNRGVMLPNGLGVVGVTDPAALSYGMEGPDLDKALAGVRPGAVKLFLSHRPELARQACKEGFALQISGHTHGGMVWGLDRVVARANGGFVSGFYDVKGMPLYVSNGTCLWSGFPFRLGSPSEITCFTLVGKR